MSISGEPMVKDPAAQPQHFSPMTFDQLWLDDIANDDDRLRSFVAIPLGSGYSAQAREKVFALRDTLR